VWPGIVTQVPIADLSSPHKDHRHSALSFLSGRCNSTEYGCSILEKETYGVLATHEGMHWLTATPQGFDLFTDHNNLIFIFDPLAVVPDLSQTTIRKVLRWAVCLSIYRHTCYHIRDEENIWADLLGRWSVGGTIRRLVHITELSSTSTSAFEWPTPDTVKEAK